MVTMPFTTKRKSRPSPDSMTLGEHLGELRYRVVLSTVAFVVAATVCVFAYEPILHFLLRPLCTVDASNTKHHTSKDLHRSSSRRTGRAISSSPRRSTGCHSG